MIKTPNYKNNPIASDQLSYARETEGWEDDYDLVFMEGPLDIWEEKNQKKGYAISEVRFVEIQETLCSDVSRGETQVNFSYLLLKLCP